MEHHDAVIVGARCAGSASAIELARLEALGVLDRLRAKHRLPLYESRIRGLGHEIVGPFTPVGGYDRAAAPRRVVLDEAGVETALAAGADGRFGTRVVELLGSGSEDDPVRGVVLDDGDRISARWVFGADGRGSTVARRLGLEKRLPLRGEIAIAYAYWEGIRDDGYGHMQIEYDGILNRVPVEDGLTMVIANGPPELTHGTTSGLSPGGAFRVAAPARCCSRAGPPSPTPARTCATASPGRSSRHG